MKSLSEFKNRPTFNIALRLCNDAYERDFTRYWMAKRWSITNLPSFIWSLFNLDDIPNSTQAELFDWAWEQVDWEQVAEAVLSCN